MTESKERNAFFTNISYYLGNDGHILDWNCEQVTGSTGEYSDLLKVAAICLMCTVKEKMSIDYRNLDNDAIRQQLLDIYLEAVMHMTPKVKDLISVEIKNFEALRRINIED